MLARLQAPLSRKLLKKDVMKIKIGQFGSGLPNADWRLNDGTGDRIFRQHIDFEESFSEVPAIALGISYLESTVAPVRVAVEAKNVGKQGFDVDIRTWFDTHVWSCGGSWIAYTPGAKRGFGSCWRPGSGRQVLREAFSVRNGPRQEKAGLI
jgi:H-type lectin domain